MTDGVLVGEVEVDLTTGVAVGAFVETVPWQATVEGWQSDQ